MKEWTGQCLRKQIASSKIRGPAIIKNLNHFKMGNV